jgi:hypothetical protein
MRTTALLVFGACAGAVLVTSAFSSSLGVFPGAAFVFGWSASTPSCGACHGNLGFPPGGNGLRVSVTPTARSLAFGQAISVTVSATGGAVNPNNEGGIAGFATYGTFVAGSGTQVGFQANDITHTSKQNNRTWTFGYNAPTSRTGPTDLYFVVNTVDGDSLASVGDMFAFHNYDGTSTSSTPVRLFVNATGVTAFGSACVGSFLQHPVLGASQSPTVGNQGFAMELVGAAPLAPAAVLIGVPPFPPFDLSAIGITGCTLYVNSLVSFSGATSAGDPQRAEGTASFPLPIPALAFLRGLALDAQVAIVDLNNGRNVPVTMTNALSIVIQ